MSSKADDFDVRYRDGRDGRDGRAWGSGADGDYAGGGYAGNDHGVLGGTVDYDLGYDANGWDTQGFRSPAAGYLDNHETAQPGGSGPPAGPENGYGNGSENGYGNGHESGRGARRGGSHARTTSTEQLGAPNWAPEAPAQHRPLAPGPARPARPSSRAAAAAGPARGARKGRRARAAPGSRSRAAGGATGPGGRP